MFLANRKAESPFWSRVGFLSYMFITCQVLRFHLRRWAVLDYAWECSRERQFLHELMAVIPKVKKETPGKPSSAGALSFSLSLHPLHLSLIQGPRARAR